MEQAAASSVSTEEVEIPRLTVWVAFGLLIVVTVVSIRSCFYLLSVVSLLFHFELVAITAEFLVGSIDGLTKSGHISEEWVSLILLPIVSDAAHAAEHVTAVTVSMKDKLGLSMGVAVGSSIQIALFVIP